MSSTGVMPPLIFGRKAYPKGSAKSSLQNEDHGPARLLLLAHLPIMLVEGLVTMFTVSFIMRVRPELLGMPPVQPDNGQEDACFNPQSPRPPTEL